MIKIDLDPRPEGPVVPEQDLPVPPVKYAKEEPLDATAGVNAAARKPRRKDPGTIEDKAIPACKKIRKIPDPTMDQDIVPS